MINILKPYMPIRNINIFFFYQVGETSYLLLLMNYREKKITNMPFYLVVRGLKKDK